MKILAPVLIGLSLVFPTTALAEKMSDMNHTISEISSMDASLEREASHKITDEEKTLARQWMLTDTDWIKYKQVMLGPRGIWSPGLDPITALGVSETDPRQRRKYAEIWMKMEIRRSELELAFEVERMAAAKRILGDKPLVNNAAWIEEWERKQVTVQHRVTYFVKSDCLEECEDKFNELRSAVGSNARLDIYFIGADNSEEIGKWAAFMDIPPSVVRDRKVTLNFNKGNSAKLGVDLEELPQVRVIDLQTGEITTSYKQ